MAEIDGGRRRSVSTVPLCSDGGHGNSSSPYSEFDLGQITPCAEGCVCRHVLHGAKFVVSGFLQADRQCLKRVCRKIRLMGGKVLRRVESHVTHVLVGRIGERARRAAELRINCFHPSYVDRCWIERHAKDFWIVEEQFVREYVMRVNKIASMKRGSSLRYPKVENPVKLKRSTSRCSPKITPTARSPPKPVIDEAAVAAERKQLQKRKHLINELVETEKTYLILLEFIAKNYITPLQEQCKQRISPMKTNYATAVFGPWKGLYSLHRSLLASLQESVDYSCAVLSGSSIVPGIGGSFLTHMSAFDRQYPDYITSFEQRKDFHSHALKADPVFRAFIQTRRKLTTSLPAGSENSSLKKQSLHDMLIAPVQRLPRYLMLLQGILTSTPESHPDKADVSSAVDSIKAINEKINEMKMAHEGEQRLAELLREIDGVPEAVATGKRWVVNEANVVMVDGSYSPGQRTDLPVKFLVLSDCIQIVLRTFTNRQQHLTHHIAIPYSAVLWFCRYFHDSTDPAGLPDIGIHFSDKADGSKKTLFFSCEKSATTSVTILLTNMMKAAQSHTNGDFAKRSALLTQSAMSLPSWVRMEPLLPDECREPVPALRNVTNTRSSDAFAPRVNPKRMSKTEAMLKLVTPGADRRSKRSATPTRAAHQYEPSSISRSRSFLSSVGSKRSNSRQRQSKDYKPAEPIPYQPNPQPTPTAAGNSSLMRRNSLLTAVQSTKKTAGSFAHKKPPSSNRSSIFSRSSSKAANRSLLAPTATSLSLPGDLSFCGTDATSKQTSNGGKATVERRKSLRIRLSHYQQQRSASKETQQNARGNASIATGLGTVAEQGTPRVGRNNSQQQGARSRLLQSLTKSKPAPATAV
eukprot:scpid4546/ scgid28285/ Protein ECT2; Epithelial cell-transforming sequence 2 oncogene